MSKPHKHKLVFWVKSPERALGIIVRLWAVGELTRMQREAMVRKIDAKRLADESDKNKKFDFLFAEIRHFYEHNGTERKTHDKQG